MHEEPQVPNFGEPGKGPELEEGMVLAIEPMVNAGGPLVRMGDDGWSVYSEDGSLAAHFEFTVAVTADGPAHPHPLARRRPSRSASVDRLCCRCGWGAATGKERILLVVHVRVRAALWSCPRSLLAAFSAAGDRRDAAPYGTNDAGGFRNVLPPGRERARQRSAALRLPRPRQLLPPHFADQQPLYENLVYGAPTLTEAQIPNYYKDATFGVPAGRSRIDDRTETRA